MGSFDDDANYILAARALAAGAGLTTKLRGVAPLVGVYPPGFPALLAPLAVMWPHGVLPFRDPVHRLLSGPVPADVELPEADEKQTRWWRWPSSSSWR